MASALSPQTAERRYYTSPSKEPEQTQDFHRCYLEQIHPPSPFPGFPKTPSIDHQEFLLEILTANDERSLEKDTVKCKEIGQRIFDKLGKKGLKEIPDELLECCRCDDKNSNYKKKFLTRETPSESTAYLPVWCLENLPLYHTLVKTWGKAKIEVTKEPQLASVPK